MQRTAVLYAVAAATLAGAFLLVIPRAAPTPEPPPPPTPAPTGHPVTHLSFADGVLRVDAKLDRGFIERAVPGSEPLWMDVTLEAVASGERAPLAAVLVIDRSGSMAGEKIDNARMAAERFIRRLENGDQLAIVTYGTDVTTDLPLTTVSAQTRAQALAVVQRLEEGGGTNIDGAMREAARMARAGFGGRVGRVILVSDGRATEGERRTAALAAHAETLRGLGVTTSTLGVGLDYHEDLMETLAVNGGGRYHYLKRASLLGKILDDEFKHASQIVARDVNVVLPRELGGFAVAAAPGHHVELGGAAVIRVGDLASGEVRRVLVRLDPVLLDRSGAAAAPGQHLRLPAPEITYRAPTSSAQTVLAHRADTFRVAIANDPSEVEGSRREDVRARVLEVLTAAQLSESMADYARGDVDEAANKLEQRARLLKDVAARTKNARLESEAQNLDRVIGQLKAAAPSSTAGADLVKEQKARAYELRR